MGAIEKFSKLFEMPGVETGIYRCQSCGTDLGSGDGTCPDCGGDLQPVSEPVQYIYREQY